MSLTFPLFRPLLASLLSFWSFASRLLLLTDQGAHLAFLSPPSSFLIRRAGTLYSRRESKIVSLLVSLFTSAYVYHWTTYFPPSAEEPLGKKLLYPPTFDGRIVCYPSEKEVRDYFSWRQVDSPFSFSSILSSTSQ